MSLQEGQEQGITPEEAPESRIRVTMRLGRQGGSSTLPVWMQALCQVPPRQGGWGRLLGYGAVHPPWTVLVGSVGHRCPADTAVC